MRREAVVRFAVERLPPERVALVDRLVPAAVARARPERAVLAVEERPAAADGVTAARSLSKSLSSARLVLRASARSAFIVLVNSL